MKEGKEGLGSVRGGRWRLRNRRTSGRRPEGLRQPLLQCLPEVKGGGDQLEHRRWKERAREEGEAPAPPQESGPACLSTFLSPPVATAHLATLTLMSEAVLSSGCKHKLHTNTDQGSRSGFDPYYFLCGLGQVPELFLASVFSCAR